MTYRSGRFWQPDVTVATVVVRDGKLLMVEERAQGRLVFNQPAGHLEPDESLVEAALRETREETGWDVRLTGFVGAYQWKAPLQADGSGMYTVQALWTQAREQLDCVTVVYANRTYATLHGEMKNVGVQQMGENARRMLDLDNPSLDWAHLARGMGVEAVRVDTVEDFTRALQGAFGRKGPYLIEALI